MSTMSEESNNTGSYLRQIVPCESQVSTLDTILVVDDDPNTRMTVKFALEYKKRFSVLMAESGQAAMKIAQEFPGRIDLALTDVIMPGEMSGLDTARELMKIRPGIVVVYMSGYPRENQVVGPIPNWAPYLQKPYGPRALTSTILSALGRDHLDPENQPRLGSLRPLMGSPYDPKGRT